MKRIFVLLPFVALIAACAPKGGETAALHLAPGKTEIVVAPGASPVTRFAAEELRNFLSKTMGADVPLAESPSEGKASLVLGVNEWSKAAGVDPSALPRDGFWIKTFGNRVYIAGVDDAKVDIKKLLPLGVKANFKFERGTLFGVYEFLERFAGVRFYFPGELGTVLQPKAVVEIPQVDLKSSPWFTVRHYYQRGDGDWAAEADCEYGEKTGENLNWIRTRMHTFRIAACHGQNGFNITRRFRDTHPEYLQMRKDGSRDTELLPEGKAASWRNYHLCQTGGVWDQFYRDILEYYRLGRRPPKGVDGGIFYGDYIDVMPQDGFKRCFCEKCQASYSATDRDYASELIWSKTAELAKRLKAAGFPAVLTQNAYFPYGSVPKCDIPDNVRVMVARRGPWTQRHKGDMEGQIADVKAWAEKTGGERPVWIWTYPGKCGQIELPLLPQMSPRAYAKYYGAMAPLVFGAFAESESDKTIFNYLNYYVFGKIAWNGKVDIEPLLEEHHRLMFGPAAAEMGRFFDELEEKWVGGVMGREGGLAMSYLGPMVMPPSSIEIWTKIYNPETIGRWEKLFADAAAKTAPESIEAKRIAFFKREFLDGLAAESRRMAAEFSVERELERRRREKPVNLLANGEFDSFAGWTPSTNGTARLNKEEGVLRKGAIELVSDNAQMEGPFVRASAKYMLDKGAERMKRNTRYRLSFFVKCENVKTVKRDAGVTLCFHDNIDRAAPAGGFITGTTDWVHVSVEFLSKKNTNIGSLAFVQPRITNATGKAWFDGILIEELK